uniref:Uncharacterized protein n=1 Tax=Avena sativa TaxID=4498 RepID=A0ACD5YEA3_AVESA
MMKPGCSPLLLSGHLLLCLTAISVLATPDVPAGQRPGCLAKCGNVDIPFPFGVGDHCALNPNFTFNCNKTMDGSMKLFKWNLEVTEISVPDGKAWVIAPTISWRCYYYASTRSMVKSDGWLNVTNSPFWISEVDNKIIVIGCHTLAYMRSFSYVIGCYSTCSNGNLKNGICSGAGCCQADVPEGVRYYSGNFDEAYNTTSKDRPCSYMVLMQKDAFRLNTSYVDSTVFYEAYNGSVPVVLNWEIQQLTCEVARQNMSSYACMSSNSECLNSTNEQGYRCRCSHGYQGNPYIKDGCTDIDECHENDNPCGLEICQNTLGNYNCSCRLGYYKTDGVCVPNPSRFRPMPVIGKSLSSVSTEVTSLVEN